MQSFAAGLGKLFERQTSAAGIGLSQQLVQTPLPEWLLTSPHPLFALQERTSAHTAGPGQSSALLTALTRELYREALS